MSSLNWWENIRSLGVVDGENKQPPFSIRVESFSHSEFGWVDFEGPVIGNTVLPFVRRVYPKADTTKVRAVVSAWASPTDSARNDAFSFYEPEVSGGSAKLLCRSVEDPTTELEIVLWRVSLVSVNNRGSAGCEYFDRAYEFLPNCLGGLLYLREPQLIAEALTEKWQKALSPILRNARTQYFKWVERDDERGCPAGGWWQLTAPGWDYFFLSVDSNGVVYPPYVPLGEA